MKKNIILTVLIAMIGVFASSAQADILIDFNAVFVGATTSPDTSGRYWNGTALNPVTGDYIITNAVDSDNNATTIDLNVISGTWLDDNGNGSTSSSSVDWDADQTQDNWIVQGTSDITLRFEGLAAGESYDLGFYGGRPGYAGRVFDITIGVTTVRIDPDDFETITGVTADANGYITATLSAPNGGSNAYGYLGGIEIVPEPATMTLLLLGLPLALRRRRK
ncbi:MAG: PEP-CTERM sorting domain-containing protein [Phycisphaerae bacterium]|nr:PEP-CTERM sorting domain-containing protein [Phycisphaerae bacterium]